MPARKVAYHDETETVQMRLYKSLKVWSMYADLEESFGTFKVCYSFTLFSLYVTLFCLHSVLKKSCTLKI